MTAERYVDNSRASNGNFAAQSGATIEFYAKGTLTPQAVYSDDTLQTSLGATVTADADGQFPEVYLDMSKEYRAIQKDADGVTQKDIALANVATTVRGLLKLPESPRYDRGAAADGTTDDTAEVQAALNARDLAQIDAEHLIDGTIDVAFDQSMRGFSRSATLKAGTTLTNDIMVRNNSNADATAWVNQYPNMVGTTIENIFFDAEDRRAAGDKVTAIAFGGSPTFRNLRFRGVAEGIKAVGLYNDKVRFENIHFVDGIAEQTSTQRLIKLGLGDGVVLDGVGFPQYATQDANASNRLLPNGLYAFTAAGLVANGLINGYNKVERCHAVTVNGGHFENGGLDFVDSTGTVNACVFWRRSNSGVYVDFDIEPIAVRTSSQNSIYSGAVTLNDCVVTYWRSWNGGYPVGGYDIKQSGEAALVLNNCARRAGSENTAVGPTTLLGLTAWDGTNPIASFNNYSHIASRESTVRKAQVEMTADLPAMSAGIGLGAGISTDDRSTWQLGTGTWYFRSQVLYDKVRLAGYEGSTERSVALTNGGSGVRLQISGPNFPHIQRIYFGSATGSYQYYVDVPVESGNFVYLDGADCEGFAVVDRGSGSAMSAINTLTGGFQLSSGDNGTGPYGVATIRTTGAATVPTEGTWRAGDRILGSDGSELHYDGTSWAAQSTGWTLVDTVDFGAAAAATGEVTGLGGYDEIMIVVDSVTASGVATRRVRFSVDGGSTYFDTSGDYRYYTGTDGVTTDSGAAAFHTTGTVSAVSGKVIIQTNQSAIKDYVIGGWQGGGGIFDASTSPVNAVQISLNTADNMNGGEVRVYGR